MFFSNYRAHRKARIRPELFWEYDMNHFNWQQMRQVVVQRVIERGRMDDYWHMFNLYGVRGVKEAIRQLPYLNAKDMNFVCVILGMKKEELKCYTQKQLRPQHWNS